LVHEYVSVSQDGTISLKKAPDHEASQTISFSVEARYVNEEQGEWHGRRDITINVTDVVDEQLSLVRDTTFRAGEGITLVEGQVSGDEVPGDEVMLDENTPASRVLYKVVVPDPDVAGNHVYFYLGGDDAGLFAIDVLGDLAELRLKASADHETKSTYNVTIYARELAIKPDAHNQEIHPSRTTDVRDAAHHVKINVIDVDEAPQDFEFDIIEGKIDEGPATTTRTALARLSVTDPDRADAFRKHDFTLSGPDEALFEIEGGFRILTQVSEWNQFLND
jgi:hypothetical protein